MSSQRHSLDDEVVRQVIERGSPLAEVCQGIGSSRMARIRDAGREIIAKRVALTLREHVFKG